MADEDEVEPRTSWFTLRVLPGREATVRTLLVSAIEGAGLAELVTEVALPMSRRLFRGWPGPGRWVGQKQVPGFLFVRIRVGDTGAVPPEVLELFRRARGVGAIDCRGGEPAAVPWDVARRLNRAEPVGWVPGSSAGGTRGRQQQRLVRVFGPGRRHDLETRR